jgi:hypothetical protein
MARTIILRTKDDARVWLVNLDGKTVSEIENDAVHDDALVLEADVINAAGVRTAAASHALFDA